MIRVLVVDDSALMRKKLREMLQSDKEIEVIATARDGNDGVAKARELKPDVVTMDINMPGLDGISALQYIVNEEICPVIIVSSLSQEGALISFEALELGAFDVIGKPGGTISLNIAETRTELISKVKAAVDKGTLRRLKRRRAGANALKKKREEPVKDFRGAASYSGGTETIQRAVAIGISTGGPRTIMDVLPVLPPDLGAPVFLVQHMPPAFTASFAERLNKVSQIPVLEAVSGDVVCNNTAYLAKGGEHLLLRKNNSGKIILRLSSLPNHLFVPSVGVMMESVLSVFGPKTLGVLMTGMGDDGADAMVRIRNTGGYTIAESQETAIVWGMPREAIERGGAETVLPSYAIADNIVRMLNHWKGELKK